MSTTITPPSTVQISVQPVLRVSVHPRQRRDPLLYRPCALNLICRLLAVGSISTPVVT